MINKLKFEIFGVPRDYEIDSDPGDKMRQTFREKIDESGIKVLVEDDYFDQDEVIQSFEDSVNVNKIIERYMAGDESALDRAKAFYADVSKVPKNMAQIIDMNNRAMNAFYQLPVELQDMFGNSYMEFLNHPEILDEYVNSKNNAFVGDKVVADAGTEEKSVD